MLKWYQARLAARPLLTQAITTSFLFGVGDITAQQLVERKGLEKHDFIRTSRMLLYGGVVFGPCAATWFRILQRHVNIPNRPNSTILARVACDQGLFAPTFICIFLSSMAMLEGASPVERLRTSYWQALATNWMIWPFVQLANFKLVPLQYRLLFVNVIGGALKDSEGHVKPGRLVEFMSLRFDASLLHLEAYLLS
ncbi:uncharacterized protein CTHT_0058620 [Thermochaetoides thermophila DSM 1495]|uniref:Integral membrane protein n=1 Tax=Chaetomium thermophilum (strain DSM 1495 / CBS 144.50 / IMI 039719) TaxID=759272 RepID=G0SCW6_CHATD|nr:hypothetical protein CTHT_0058620 [Thermochaetoides thermophila DSM 1495]EGS19237.1 hypothetical protein CTHT_0058620 [Thermochaetoides thermophila DSM 1495]